MIVLIDNNTFESSTKINYAQIPTLTDKKKHHPK